MVRGTSSVLLSFTTLTELQKPHVGLAATEMSPTAEYRCSLFYMSGPFPSHSYHTVQGNNNNNSNVDEDNDNDEPRFYLSSTLMDIQARQDEDIKWEL